MHIFVNSLLYGTSNLLAKLLQLLKLVVVSLELLFQQYTDLIHLSKQSLHSLFNKSK